MENKNWLSKSLDALESFKGVLILGVIVMILILGLGYVINSTRGIEVTGIPGSYLIIKGILVLASISSLIILPLLLFGGPENFKERFLKSITLIFGGGNEEEGIQRTKGIVRFLEVLISFILLIVALFQIYYLSRIVMTMISLDITLFSALDMGTLLLIVVSGYALRWVHSILHFLIVGKVDQEISQGASRNTSVIVSSIVIMILGLIVSNTFIPFMGGVLNSNVMPTEEDMDENVYEELSNVSDNLIPALFRSEGAKGTFDNLIKPQDVE